MHTLIEILDPAFVLRNSVYASLLIGAAVPLAGIYLVLSRRTLLALALPEAGGMGVAFTAWVCALTGIPLAGGHGTHVHEGMPFFVLGLFGAFAAMSLCLVLLLWIDRHANGSQDAESGAAFSLAFGLTLAFAASNLIPEIGLLDMMKGEILAVSNRMLVFMTLGFGLVTGILMLLRHPLQLVLYDRRLAFTAGLPANGLAALAAGLICVTIALGGLCAGPLAIFTFLILPGATLQPFVRRLPALYLLTPLLGMLCGLGGFWVSYALEDWNLPTSAAQITLLGGVWLCSRLYLLCVKTPMPG